MLEVRDTRMPSPPPLATTARVQERLRNDPQQGSGDEIPVSGALDMDISESPATEGGEGRGSRKKGGVPPQTQEGGGSPAASGEGDELSSSKGVFHASGTAQVPPEQRLQAEYVEEPQG